MNDIIFEYMAFISYSRKDETWAKWLQYKLEHYILPTSLSDGDTNTPNNLRPIFRDKTDLRPGVLSERIKEALRGSRFLIVVCSPNAVASKCIEKEIDGFIELGGEKRIIPFKPVKTIFKSHIENTLDIFLIRCFQGSN